MESSHALYTPNIILRCIYVYINRYIPFPLKGIGGIFHSRLPPARMASSSRSGGQRSEEQVKGGEGMGGEMHIHLCCGAWEAHLLRRHLRSTGSQWPPGVEGEGRMR